MKPIVREMYELLVRLHQSPFTRDPERAQIEELLDRATSELLGPELVVDDGEPKKLICHLMDLNIEADKPTVTGRVYSRETLERAIQKKQVDIDEGRMLVFKQSGGFYNGRPEASKMFGVVERMRLGDDGKLFGSGFLVQTPLSGDLEFVKMMLDEGKLQFSMGGRGKVDENGVVSDYDMTHVSIDRVAGVELQDISFVGPGMGGEPIKPPEPPEPPPGPAGELIKE